MAMRGKRVALTVGAVALSVLVLAVFLARESILFEYHAWRLSTGDVDEKCLAARELLKLNPGRATVAICREIGEICDSDGDCAKTLAATVSSSRADLFPEGHYPFNVDWIMSHVSLCDAFAPDAQHAAAAALKKIQGTHDEPQR